MSKGFVCQFLFLIFVIAAASVAYYDYSKNQKTSEKEHSQFITDRKFKNLSKIEIKNSKSTILLLKKNDDWFLKKPIQGKASFKEVSRWFDEIQIQAVRKIEIEENASLKDYYLENSPKVKLTFSNGEIISFSVSSKGSFDGKFFIKKDGELFLGEYHFSREVNDKDPKSFRYKKPKPKKTKSKISNKLK